MVDLIQITGDESNASDVTSPRGTTSLESRRAPLASPVFQLQQLANAAPELSFNERLGDHGHTAGLRPQEIEIFQILTLTKLVI